MIASKEWKVDVTNKKKVKKKGTQIFQSKQAHTYVNIATQESAIEAPLVTKTPGPLGEEGKSLGPIRYDSQNAPAPGTWVSDEKEVDGAQPPEISKHPRAQGVNTRAMLHITHSINNLVVSWDNLDGKGAATAKVKLKVDNPHLTVRRNDDSLWLVNDIISASKDNIQDKNTEWNNSGGFELGDARRAVSGRSLHVGGSGKNLKLGGQGDPKKAFEILGLTQNANADYSGMMSKHSQDVAAELQERMKSVLIVATHDVDGAKGTISPEVEVDMA
ncbi:hypothetical protein [Pseudoalteromonas sp. MMG012]|uniref:hypothetical protein n=1 Tax=Pseudoalteromonas sp. MMG012 TaxID=2822686 RepID=UPI001B3A36B3|nr:hypothetical protein [Pseudoalteromonas sp. MMG012]MBQ4852165.1 hypothetical protein [Pseudoalteromonas sp. MMG012]